MARHWYHSFIPAFVTLTVITVISSSASSQPQAYDTEKAYLIIKASTAVETEKQPTWIGILRKYMRTKHVSANDLIVGVNPGKYRISHFDFDQDQDGTDTVFMKRSERFQLQAGRVYIMGHYTLKRIRKNRYDISVAVNHDLLVSACNKAPEFFKHFPLGEFGTDKLSMVQCSEILKTTQSD